MPLYRFRILNKSGRVVASQSAFCANDDGARAHAAMLAAETRTHPIEISEGEPRVAVETGDAEKFRREARRLREEAELARGKTRINVLEIAGILEDAARGGG